jgi:Domain of unknown function (DU1801)
MAKMQPTGTEVEAFLEAVPNAERRADARELCALLSEITGEPPMLWASGIVGFGSYHYRYDSGREGDAPVAGFAPRSAHLVIYLIGGFADTHERLLERLGPHKTGKSCLYVKRLADVDLDVLRTLVTRSMKVHRGQNRASER